MEQSVRKQMIKRNIRFWGYQTERILGMLMLMSFLYSLIGSKFRVAGEESILLTMFMYMSIVGVIMILILPMTYATSYVPLTLSMGSGRKESLLGMQFGMLLLFAQLMILMGIGLVITSITTGEYNTAYVYVWMTVAILLFAAMVISQFGAWLNLRYGMKGIGIYIVVFVILLLSVGFSVGMVAGRMARNGVEAVFAVESMKAGLEMATISVLVVGMFVYLLGYHLVKKAIMNYEVYR